MAINQEELNKIIDERDMLVKQLNIVIFAKLFNVVLGICDALKVDLESSISLLNVHHVEEKYVFNIFLHTPGTKKEETVGEELFIDLPYDIVLSDNRKIIETYILERLLLETTPVQQNRTLH